MRKLPHPIPYQGSKCKLAPIIAWYYPKNIRTFYEPFAGSAAMTIYTAYHGRESQFVVADSLEPMVNLLRYIVDAPERTAAEYHKIWKGQKEGGYAFFNKIRDRYAIIWT